MSIPTRSLTEGQNYCYCCPLPFWTFGLGNWQRAISIRACAIRHQKYVVLIGGPLEILEMIFMNNGEGSVFTSVFLPTVNGLTSSNNIHFPLNSEIAIIAQCARCFYFLCGNVGRRTC